MMFMPPRHYATTVKKIRKATTLFDSMRDTHRIIDTMMKKERTLSLMSPSGDLVPRASSRLLHPPAIREKGVIDIAHCDSETASDTPKRHMKKSYENRNKKHLNRS